MMTFREQGFVQNFQQPLQQETPFGYPSQQSQQDMSQFGFAQPLPQQGFGQQGLGPLGYLQQPLQGFSQPAPQLQQKMMPQFDYSQPLPQQGFGQQGSGPYQQPQQDFGGQAGQFVSGYDIYQQSGRAEFDVPRDRRGPKNYARSSELIRELICERVIQNLFIDVSDVSIEVQGGRVALDGTVPNRQMKHAIEDV